jgi:ubiquinone/menaquinone biosynthesis C-methylase UbiE
VNQTYVLDRSDRELDRLDLQGIIYRDATRRALTDCGIAPGMRVLDIGCGSGDVARLAASLVGPSGSVLGVDMNAESVGGGRAGAGRRGGGGVKK